MFFQRRIHSLLEGGRRDSIHSLLDFRADSSLLDALDLLDLLDGLDALDALDSR